MVRFILEGPCTRRDLLIDSPFMRKLQFLMGFVSPLELVDPRADNFTPEGAVPCRM